MITNKVKWSNITRGTWCKENSRYEYITRKTKVVPQNIRVIENKLRLGQGRAGIRCKKPHLIESITASESKSCEIPKILMTHNATKNIMDFPV